MNEYYSDYVNELDDGTLLVVFDFGDKGKRNVFIKAEERTPCEVWSRVIRLRSS